MSVIVTLRLGPRLLSRPDHRAAGQNRCRSQAEPFDAPTLEAAFHTYGESSGRTMGDLVNAARVAITGQGIGPGLYDCLVILGRDDGRRRLAETLANLRPGS